MIIMHFKCIFLVTTNDEDDLKKIFSFLTEVLAVSQPMFLHLILFPLSPTKTHQTNYFPLAKLNLIDESPLICK